MKVNVDNDVFLVHFETRKHNPLHLKEKTYKEKPSRQLSTVTCHVRFMNPNSVKTEISVGKASQNYQDKDNLVFGRKIAFSRAINGFDKKTRTVFWDTYKENSRYIV